MTENPNAMNLSRRWTAGPAKTRCCAIQFHYLRRSQIHRVIERKEQLAPDPLLWVLTTAHAIVLGQCALSSEPSFKDLHLIL